MQVALDKTACLNAIGQQFNKAGGSASPLVSRMGKVGLRGFPKRFSSRNSRRDSKVRSRGAKEG